MPHKNLVKEWVKFLQQEWINASFLNTHLLEIFKNHKLMKIFQKENYEFTRINDKLEQCKKYNKKNSKKYLLKCHQ